MAWGLFVLAVVLFLANLYAARSALMDDAFISFRYARNLGLGRGLAFNPGGPPVEGYTNLLFILLLAPLINLGLDPYVAARGISILSVACSLPFLARAYEDLNGRRADARNWFVLAFLFLGYHGTAYHASLGLETSLFTLLVIAQFSALVRLLLKSTPRGIAAFYGLGLLATLVRPEGFALTCVWSAFLIPGARKERSHVIGFAAFGLSVGLYLLWKYLYFGAVLPNSFFLKISRVSGFLPGAKYTRGFLLAHAGLLVLCGLWCFRARRARLVLFAPLLAALLLALALYSRSLPAMGWQYRFFAPFVVALLIPASSFVGDVYGAFRRSLAARPIVGAGATLLLAATLVLALGEQTWRSAAAAAKEALHLGLPRRDSTFDLHYAEADLGRRIANLGFGSRLSIAFWDAGAIPFYSDCVFLDTAGLTDTFIARQTEPGGIVRYILARNPDIIILAVKCGGRLPDDLFSTGFGVIGRNQRRLFEAAQRVGYAPVGVFRTNYYDLHFLLSPSSRHRETLLESLPGAVGSRGEKR